MEFLLVTLFLLGSVVCLLLVAISRDRRIPPKLPPGPAGIPVLGYIPWLSGTPYRDFHKLTKQYGDIFSVRLGKRWHVVLNSSRMIRRALVENGAACSGRPFWILNKVLKKRKAIANEQPGSQWRMHRAFWFHLFRQLGKDKMHKIIREELECFKASLMKDNGRPMDPTSLVKLTFSNIICRFCFGKRYAAEDPEFHRLQHNADTFMQSLSKASRTLPFFGKGEKLVQDIMGAHKGVIDFIKERIEEHKTLRLREKVRTCDDLLDVYFNSTEQKDEVDHIGILPDISDCNMNPLTDQSIDRGKRSLADEIDEGNLPHIVLDIFVGGLETINAAMMWSLLAMVRYPDVQVRVQRELDDIVGRHHLLEYNQINDLPHTKATLLEVYRLGNVIPIAIPHCVTQPVTIDGYHLPVGTRILSNIYSAHMDPEEWDKPEEFDPSRFMNEDGQVKIPPAYMPFSVGKRVCMGENLAKKELFLAFTTVLRNFTILPAHDGATPEFEGIPGTTRCPIPFMIRAVPREKDG